MDENQTNNSEVSELKAECAWLRRQVQIIFSLVIVVSATLTLYLWRQVRYLNADLNSLRPNLQEYNEKQKPMMDQFIQSLVEYDKTHPDFNAIYQKYGLSQATNLTVAPKQ